MYTGKTVVQKLEKEAPPLNLSASPEGVIIDMVYCLASELSLNPQIYLTKNNTIWIYFPGSCFSCDELIIEYGVSAAFVSQTHPLLFCGNSTGRETAEITAELSKDKKIVTCKKSNISGNNYDQLFNICVKINISSKIVVHEMIRILKNIDYLKDFVAVKRTACTEEILSSESDFIRDAYYRYIPMRGDCDLHRCTVSLPINMQKKLWLVFLNDGVSPPEFEYVHDAWEVNENLPFFSWELSLKMAVSAAGYSIKCDENGFEIRKNDGRRVIYDYENGSAAEKLFLKILFPVPAASRSCG